MILLCDVYLSPRESGSIEESIAVLRISNSLTLLSLSVVLTVVFARPAAADLAAVPRMESDGVSRAEASLTFQQSSMRLAQSGQRIKRSSSQKKGGKAEAGANSGEPCTACEGLEGFVSPDGISDEIREMVGKTIGDKDKAVAIQKARGGIETGLVPTFILAASCPKIDSEKWAIDYSNKRPGAAIHKGIDIPQPRGTPILAVSSGTVVGRFMNEGNRKGIEVMLRHTPEQTGLPFWTYSQYTHLSEMSPLVIGEVVKMGQEVGNTSNTGEMGRRIRRDALHFAILYSELPEWSNDGRFVIPKDSYWMDPNAFYRLEPPYESRAVLALPDEQKKVPTPYMKTDSSFVPETTKRIWPYPCR